MKKFIGILIGCTVLSCTVLICSIVMTNCTKNHYTESEEFTDRFYYIEDIHNRNLYQRIIVDKETGVMYLFHCAGYKGGLTVMVDANGKPLIYDDKQ